MSGDDGFTRYYAPLLDNTYDVVDRIVINAYFGMGCSPGGFRRWWYDLHGTFDNLDDTHLMRMAGRFSRRVRGWAKKHDIPVIYCKDGQRKHRIAAQYVPDDPSFEGIFAVLVGRMKAPVWKVLRFPSGGFHIKRRDPMPFVNHYLFQIMDREWGHVTIAVSGHAPFRAMVMLNGHEYTACRARGLGVTFTKEDNCFTEVSDADDLARAADTLRSRSAIGQLRQVCDRWVYRCACFGLSFDEQDRSGFHYSYSLFQMEYSRNLLFKNGHRMEQVFDGVIDRTRARFDIKRVLRIFGRKHRRIRRKGTPPREQVVLEIPTYDLTVFKVHFGSMTLKIYTKGECVLRCEAVAHYVGALRCGRVLDRFPTVAEHLAQLLTRFLDSLSCVDRAWLTDTKLDQLPTPSVVGRTRVAGVDINRARLRLAMEAVLALALAPNGFSSAQLAAKVRELQGRHPTSYTPRQAAYDLKKLRGKGLLEKTTPRGRRYRATPEGLRTMAALIVLREKVIKPLLHYRGRRKSGPKPRQTAQLDRCYQAVQHQMQHLFQTLNLVA